MLRGFPFLRFEVTRHIVSGYWSAGNGHKNVLHVGKRQAFKRPEHAVLVNGLERRSHVIQFNGSSGASLSQRIIGVSGRLG